MKKIYSRDHILRAQSLTISQNFSGKSKVSYREPLMRAISLQCCRRIEPNSTLFNVEVICAKVCKNPFTCAKILFNFASTLSSSLQKVYSHKKTLMQTLQNVDRVICT